MNDIGILLIGHGSHLPFNEMIFRDIREKIENKTGIKTEVGYVKLTKPSIDDAVSRLDASRIIAQPLMLSEGVMTKEIIAEKLPDNVKLISAIGPDEVIADILHEKVEKALKKSKLSEDASTRVILMTHGSKLEYNMEFLMKVRNDFDEKSDFKTSHAFMKYNEPSIQEEFRKMGDVERVVVMPIFVADGIHTITDIPIILGLMEPPEPCPFMKNGKHHPDHINMHNDNPNHRPQHHDLEIIDYDGEVLLGDSLFDDDRLVERWCENILKNI